MLLALWAGFAGTWGGSAASSHTYVPVIAPLSFLAPGGKGLNAPNNTYQMLSDDYWEVREANLTGKMPVEEPRSTERLDTPARRAMLDAIKTASSFDEMKAASAKLHKYDGTA